MHIHGHHTILLVSDPAAAKGWLAAALDRQPALDVPGMTEFHLPGGGVIGLMPEAGLSRLVGATAAPVPSTAGVRVELYLRVDDPAAAHARSLAAGAREQSGLAPRDWGDEVAYSLGPDGVLLAFARRIVGPSRPIG